MGKIKKNEGKNAFFLSKYLAYCNYLVTLHRVSERTQTKFNKLNLSL